MSKIKLLKADHHRNGVSGAGFGVAIFKNGKQKMLGILFEERGYCAFLDMDLLTQDVIEFGLNSWRCEEFEDELRPMVAKRLEEQFEKMLAEWKKEQEEKEGK